MTEFPLRKITGPGEHGQALAIVARFAGQEMIDEGIVDYLGVLIDLIVAYEKRASYATDTSGISAADVVRHLMAENNLTISGLAREIGVGQSNLSEMLSGKREWSKAAIRGLSERFSLNPMLFLA